MLPLESSVSPRAQLTLSVVVGRHGNELRVRGELDLSTANKLDRALRWLECGARRLWLNLRGVAFVDCAGWRPIGDAVTRRRNAGAGAVELVAVSPAVRRLALLIVLCDTEDLLASMSAKPG